MRILLRIFLIPLLFLGGCEGAWNDPYSATVGRGMTLYSSFSERPKHLDPVQSYTEDEAKFTQQIYEPLLQYHYLKRPYELLPLTTLEVPKAREIEGGKYTVYDIRIRPGIKYQPHPAFVEKNMNLDAAAIGKLRSPYELRSAEH